MYKIYISRHNWLIKDILNKKIKNEIQLLRGRVIDLGCGTKPFNEDILGYASEYIGIDWTNTLHKSHADIIADLNKPLPLDSNFADHVVSFEVLEHLAEPTVALSEAYRILRKGGNIIVSVPFQWWVHEAPADYYRFTKYGLIYIFEKAGFTNISVSPTTGFWTMLTLKFNYQTARLICGPRILQLFVRVLLIPIWWINQNIAKQIDRFWREERETAGYIVTANKL